MTKHIAWRSPVDAAVLSHATIGAAIALPADAQHHALDVLRLRDGAVIELFDKQGGAVIGRLIDGKLVVEEIAAASAHVRPLILVQALAKGDKLDDVVQRATELGATEIWLWAAEHSVMKLSAEQAGKKIERLNRVADAAARQCGRRQVPLIDGPYALPALVQRIASGEMLTVVGVLDATTQLSACLRDEAERAARGIIICVGPEGGISRREIELLHRAAAHPVSWSPHVLRTETAALAALAVVHAHFGAA